MAGEKQPKTLLKYFVIVEDKIHVCITVKEAEKCVKENIDEMPRVIYGKEIEVAIKLGGAE